MDSVTFRYLTYSLLQYKPQAYKQMIYDKITQHNKYLSSIGMKSVADINIVISYMIQLDKELECQNINQPS